MKEHSGYKPPLFGWLNSLGACITLQSLSQGLSLTGGNNHIIYRTVRGSVFWLSGHTHITGQKVLPALPCTISRERRTIIFKCFIHLKH